MKGLAQRAWQWLRVNDRLIWFEYGLLAFVILLPLLKPGYILTLDLVFTPHIAWPVELTNAYPLQVALVGLYQIMPGEVVEKLILFGILLSSGVGAHALVRSLDRLPYASDVWNLASYFAGVLYMINPFTYARFMAGQWMVLLGYALLPFFVRVLVSFTVNPSWRQGIYAMLLAFMITTVSLHHIGILLLLGALAVGVGSVQYWRQKDHVKKLWIGVVGVMGGWLVFSSFWLVPTLLNQNSIGQSVDHFGTTHFEAFKTTGSSALGPISDVVRLQGFWAEGQSLFVLPQQVMPMWGIVMLVLWVLVGVGAWQAWRVNRFVAVVGVGCIVLGALLAVTPVLQWLGGVVPVLNGYREPHKFANLVVLGYALLGTFGVALVGQKLYQRYGQNVAIGAVALLAMIPIATAPTMFGGFAGQLTPRTYPPGWSEANTYVKERIGAERALFLPWHQYANYSFSDRTIANPAAKFFTFPVIISNDPEFKGVPPTTPSEEVQAMGDLLKQRRAIGERLKRYNVRYVLLAKEPDANEYGFLHTDNHLKLVLENATMKVYEVYE